MYVCDKEMLHGVQSEDDIWAECTRIILGLIGNPLLSAIKAIKLYYIEDSLAMEERSMTRRTKRVQYTNGTRERQRYNTLLSRLAFMQTTDSLPDTESVKRKRSFSDNIRDRKIQRLSTNLANDIAKCLSVTDHGEGTRPTTYSGDDVDMMNGNSIHQTSATTRRNSPCRFFRKIHRQPVSVRNGRRQERVAPADRNSFPIPTLRRISLSGSGRTYPPMDLEQWIALQAEKQHISVVEYKQRLYEKQKELHYHLSQLHTTDHSKTDTEQFRDIRRNLDIILRLADELSGDHSLSFAQIFPEWKLFEGHINKLAAYVQSIEDMRNMISQTVPRTEDLLFDIKRLQSILDAKSSLYGDNLVQNGLEWKALGMPVDEQLLAAIKGWFYNLCIGLLGELDIECSKLQSLLTGMDELASNPTSERVMQFILNGLEFISSTIVFIGLPSNKLNFGCRVLATIYGQWVSKTLENLNDMQIERTSLDYSFAAGRSNHADVKMTSATARSLRIDIRFMQAMEGMVRILGSLQSLQEISLKDNIREIGEDKDSFGTLQNFTSMLVELTVQAIAVIETSRSPHIASTSTTKSANIMTNPRMGFIYMQESLLSFAEKVVELSGREWIDSPRIQRLRAYLEDIEAEISLS
ncbi:hypothetical protein EC973_006274 [Apophysomyces ossiformis]|uniref:Uncharacterized protein n=1 Tax=Apophysomyces ossiformis TaxID=679940 RepID=A0A8H7ESF2_9FUNG|nr:hypothetical protein EC973_006274 [Apophysomyces ossiformis]